MSQLQIDEERRLAHADSHLEQGLLEGRELPLQAAIEEALGHSDMP